MVDCLSLIALHGDLKGQTGRRVLTEQQEQTIGDSNNKNLKYLLFARRARYLGLRVSDDSKPIERACQLYVSVYSVVMYTRQYF